jgi:hypothetical protein
MSLVWVPVSRVCGKRYLRFKGDYMLDDMI